MEKFNYKVLTREGDICRGHLIAENLVGARQQLREKGFAVIKLNKTAKLRWVLTPSLSARDLTLATRQLATLVAASLPIDEALQALVQQSDRKSVVYYFTQVRNKVREGHSLAASLGLFPRTFSRMYCSMVASGEASGHLPQVLGRLASNEEQHQKLKGKILQAMIYPIVLTIVASGVIGILLAAVVPKVIDQFVAMKQVLPLSTRILIVASDFVRDYGLLIIVAALSALLINTWWLKKPERRKQRHKNQLGWPLLGKLTRSINSAQYARTLSILTASAVPLLEAMRISGSVVTNEYARALLSEAEDKVREGEKFHQALKATGLFSPMMMHMVSSGERSGCLDDMLERSATMQEEQLSHQMTLAVALFEPLLVVTMASIVLFIILAILQPVLQMNEMIG